MPTTCSNFATKEQKIVALKTENEQLTLRLDGLDCSSHLENLVIQVVWLEVHLQPLKNRSRPFNQCFIAALLVSTYPFQKRISEAPKTSESW